MARTDTTKLAYFTRPNSVTYALPSPPYTSIVVTITLPPHSSWTSGLHWHETHTEYLEVVSGSALVTLESTTKVYTPLDGIITVPKFARHEWRRATPDGDPLIVKEWTDPADGQKEVFFRNLSSVIQDWVGAEGPKREWWLEWQLLVVFWALDNWPVILGFGKVPLIGKLLEWVVTHVLMGLAVLVGKLFGLRSIYEEYTPKRLGGKRQVAIAKSKEL